jgi:RHH-type rel operon transcriptional repressor/antitoxin RelB
VLAIRLDAELEARLSEAAKRAGRTKTAFARKAIEDYIEDIEDIAAAEEALRRHDPSKTVSIAELRAELGLDD